MRIFIVAKPNAHEQRIEQIDQTHYRVSVTQPPVSGKANAAIIHALAEHFHISPSALHIVSGYTSRNKVIDIA